MATLVYRYRINPMGSAAARRDVLNHPDLLTQFQFAHRLRNALVELERDQEDAMAVLWSAQPAVAAAESELVAAEAVLLPLIDAAKTKQSTTRTRGTASDDEVSITAARAAVKQARTARRAAISACYAQVKPQIETIRGNHRAAVKDLYRQFCQDGQARHRCCPACTVPPESDTCTACNAHNPRAKLHWSTYNAVVDDHRTAVKLIAQKRRNGQPAALRFHRWDGTGRIAVQLQRQAADPPRTPTTLSDTNGKWRNVLLLPPIAATPQTVWDAMSRAEQRAAGRSTIRWYLGSSTHHTLPVQFHRPLPEDSEVLQAELVRTRTGPDTAMYLCLTVRIPDPTPAEGQPVAVHIGWRRRPDGSIRVATWRTITPVTVPTNLTDVVTVHPGGTSGEIIAPATWLAAADRFNGVASTRSLTFNSIQNKVADWLTTNPQPDGPTAADVRQWRSPNRLATLALTWRANPPVGDDTTDIAAMLEAWRRQDKHLWLWHAHGTNKRHGRRDDAWRAAAAWITSFAGTVVVDDTDLAELRRRPDITDTPALPGPAADRARANAVSVAPGNLRSAVVNAAGRRGVHVATISGARLTRHHTTCGYTADTKGRSTTTTADYAARTVVTCPGCGADYDQDHNATRVLLDTHTNAT